MTKETRLNLLRERAKARPGLSETAAETLAEIQKEDPDLGSGNAFGECLAPENVKSENKPLDTEDESEIETSLISPAMREAIEV